MSHSRRSLVVAGRQFVVINGKHSLVLSNSLKNPNDLCLPISELCQQKVKQDLQFSDDLCWDICMLKLWTVVLEMDPIHTLHLADHWFCSDHFDWNDYCRPERRRNQAKDSQKGFISL